MSKESREQRARELAHARELERQRRKNLQQGAEDEKRALERLDKQAVDELKDIFGADLDLLLSDLQKGSGSDPHIRQAIDDLKSIRHDVQSGNLGKAKRRARKNMAVIKDAHKQAKKNSSCAVIAFLIFAAIGLSGWGVVELVAAIV